MVPEHQRKDAEERRGCILRSRVKKEEKRGKSLLTDPATIILAI